VQEDAALTVEDVEEELAEYRRRFGAALRFERTRAHLTLTEFAAEVGVTERTVRYWETGRVLPYPAMRRRLIRLYPGLARALEEDTDGRHRTDGRTRPGPESTSSPA